MHALTIKRSVFAIMTGLIVKILFMLFSIHNAVKYAEYEAYWLTDFIVRGMPRRNNYGDLKKSKQQEIQKFVILQSIGVIVVKSKETRMVTYTCRYILLGI